MIKDPIQYIYQFTKDNVQGPRNIPERMIEGPDGALEEVIVRTGGPIYEYQTGILWPHIVYRSEEELEKENFNKENESSDEEDGDSSSILNQKIKNRIERKGVAEGDEDTINSDEENLISLAYQRHQCAMGLSFNPNKKADFEINVFAARYLENDITDELKKREPFKSPKIKKAWYRQSIGDRKIVIKNKEMPTETGQQIRRHILGDDSDPELVFIVRKLSKSIFTAYLFNEKDGMQDTNKSTSCFFQVEFIIKSSTGFNQYSKENPLNKTKGKVSNFELLYSDFPAYAIGHGCSPEWNVEGKVNEIRAIHLPKTEIKPVKAKPLIIDNKKIDLSMNLLSNSSKKGEIISLLEKFIDTYSDWIKNKKNETGLFDNELMKNRADSNLLDCDNSCKRMKEGVESLKNYDSIFKSFCYMNKAMLLQQIRHNANSWIITDSEKERAAPTIEDRSSWSDWDTNLNKNTRLGNWRPFQLAFILMNLKALSSELNDTTQEKDREIVDLIWFPTGGGKTEAYFGLTAFNIFSRRLYNKEDDATSVITRYTYRVLTTQQFERSAALIVSCNLVRQEHKEDLGEKDIDLGLWIGNTASHRDRDQANLEYKEILKEKMKYPNKPYNKSHKFTLQSCPNCKVSFFHNTVKRGNTLGIKKVRSDGPARIEYQCPNGKCEYFNKKIPVSAVDEELYENPPTFLIGTVDKFALLPYRRKARNFLGFDSSYGPPDLIIQDELHLISGPLGSIYGIYEKLISELILKASDREDFKPKIVCSTATINSANDQIQKLYGINDEKKINIFPSNAIKIWDNFFSEVDNESKGRTYIGLMPQISSDAVTTKRYFMSSLLQAGKNLEQHLDSSKYTYDAYWTIIDYYSSLRDLGVGYSTATSDVAHQLVGFKKNYNLKPHEVRKLHNIVELTGRDPSQSIPERLKELSTSHQDGKNNTIDICLTTNMFSVGVDISRLGLMFMNNQTKTSSEYIQATSRVGRSDRGPGLVAVQYASSRPRDRSYFEQFQAYHTRFYSHVEPTSVTPSSYRVVDKALPAIIVAFIRLIKNYKNDETNALTGPDFIECKEFIKKFADICSNEKESRYIIKKADETIDKILSNVGNYNHFYPTSFNIDQGFEDVIYPENVDFKNLNYKNSFHAPTSMRSVDTESSAALFRQSYTKLLESE